MHKGLSIAVGAMLVVALAGCGGDDTEATAAEAPVTTAPDGTTAETARGDNGRDARIDDGWFSGSER